MKRSACLPLRESPFTSVSGEHGGSHRASGRIARGHGLAARIRPRFAKKRP